MGSFSHGMLVEQVALITTSGGTTTLSSTSLQIQYFTGSSAQTVKLPPTTTMFVGQFFELYNASSATITMEYQDASSFTPAATIPSNTSLIVKLTSTGTTNGTWAVATSGGVPTFSGLTQFGLVYAATTSSVATISPGTTGQILISQGSAAPVYSSTISGATTFSAAGTALTVTNNALISGSLTVGPSSASFFNDVSTSVSFPVTLQNLSNASVNTKGVGLLFQGADTSSATKSIGEISITHPDSGGNFVDSNMNFYTRSSDALVLALTLDLNQNAILAGNLTVNGGQSLVNSSNTSTNAILILNGGNSASSNGSDIIMRRQGTNFAQIADSGLLGADAGGATDLSILANSNLYLDSGGGQTLLLDTSHNATFTGNLTVNGTGNNTIAGTITPSKGILFPTVTKSASYGLTAADYMVYFTSTATATLPTAVGVAGQTYVIINASTTATNVTVNTTSSQTIGGRSSGSIVLAGPWYDQMTVISDGANWQISEKKETAVLTANTSSPITIGSGVHNIYPGGGTSVTLTEGSWRVYTTFGLSATTGSASGYISLAGGCGAYSADGVGAGQPAGLAGTIEGFTNNVNFVGAQGVGQTGIGPVLVLSTVPFLITVATTTQVFGVAEVFTSGTGASLTIQVVAERLF